MPSHSTYDRDPRVDAYIAGLLSGSKRSVDGFAT